MPGRFEPSEREALAGLSSCFNCQFQDLSSAKNIMYAVTLAELIYHLAKTDHITVCGVHMLTPLNQRRRFSDFQIVSDVPTHRVSALCSECASLSGDTRSFSQRVTYPTHSQPLIQGLAKEKAA